MRPLGVVVSPPSLDDDLGLCEAVEDLTVEQLIAQLRVEALAIAVLPWASRLDERGPRANSYDPLPHGPGDELRTVVGTDMAGTSKMLMPQPRLEHQNRPKLVMPATPSVPMFLP